MTVCAYIKPDGNRCRAGAMDDSQWCYNHSPDYAEQRRTNARKGGKRAGRGRPVTELQALKAENGQLRERMIKGELDPRMVAVAVQSINVDARLIETLLKAREQEELIARLEDLEGALEAAKENDRGYYGA
jgi:hypothetical protein